MPGFLVEVVVSMTQMEGDDNRYWFVGVEEGPGQFVALDFSGAPGDWQAEAVQGVVEAGCQVGVKGQQDPQGHPPFARGSL